MTGKYLLRKVNLAKYSKMHPASIFVTCSTSIAQDARRFYDKSSCARETKNDFLAELLLRVSPRILIRRKELLIRGLSQVPVFLHQPKWILEVQFWRGGATRNRTSATVHCVSGLTLFLVLERQPITERHTETPFL